MISNIYHAIVYQPLYNGLILLMATIPWADAGVIVILFTVIVKLCLFPLSKKAVNTQMQMRAIEPELNLLKEKYKDDKQELARKTMELYKENGVRPFMSILLIFIQLPIIFALYRVFLHSGLPIVNKDLLYGFIKIPEQINMTFLGWVDISKTSLVLAILVGVATFMQAKIMAPKISTNTVPDSEKDSFRHDFAKSMSLQMKYVFPFVAAFISWKISAAISLYWITSNLFTIGQELFLKRKIAK